MHLFKLSTELAKLHSEGNAATKFMQETVLATLQGVAPHVAGMNINHTKFELTGKN